MSEHKIKTNSNAIDIASSLNISVKSTIAPKKNDSTQTAQNIITKGDVLNAVSKELIPEFRQDDFFTLSGFKAHIAERHATHLQEYKNIEEYAQLLCTLITNIQTEYKIQGSYLISAPKSFSKTTFVNTCIKYLAKQNRLAVPYTSLLDIYALRIAQAKQYQTEERYTNLIEVPDFRSNLINDYTLKDYVNCDVLFTYFICPDFRHEELSILKYLLMTRGKMGLPTIVFLDLPLTKYLANKDDGKYFWATYLTYKDLPTPSYEVLRYKNCFKGA